MKEQIQKVRELINEPLIQSPLLRNVALWNQLCSCLDVIEDTELAINAYIRREFGESTKGYYLAIYGLLQALFVEQDAVINLCESLSIPLSINNYPQLKKIRDIRNDAIGHPTKRNRKKGQLTSYHFMSRPTVKSNGFQLMSLFGNGTSEFEDISIPSLIAEQKSYLSEILTSTIVKLEQMEKDHKEKYRRKKLVSVFPSTLSHSFGKVFDGIIEGKSPSPLALMNFQEIKRTFHNFRESIAERGITYASIDDVYRLLEYPLAELEIFFQNAQDGTELNINEKTAFIFAFFVEKQFEELKHIAQDIDKNYSS